MADPTLYLFDGYNVLHAGSFADVRELTGTLAGFVATKGARGVLVFDGVGEERRVGALEVRYAPHADALLERLAAEFREVESVCLVSSDLAVRGTSGLQVAKISSQTFVDDLEPPSSPGAPRSQLADRLDEETRTRLDRLRRRRA